MNVVTVNIGLKIIDNLVWMIDLMIADLIFFDKPVYVAVQILKHCSFQ